ncbi:unnamed protein product, partial [marine sediment metagenome]
ATKQSRHISNYYWIVSPMARNDICKFVKGFVDLWVFNYLIGNLRCLFLISSLAIFRPLAVNLTLLIYNFLAVL